MIKFAFFLKTYREDKLRVRKLIDSWNRYNVEHLKMFIMCPRSDVYEFKNLENENIEVIEEELIKTSLFTEDTQWSKGYLNQEIFKLAFWELGLCENYQCIDSDALFIRPFYIKDFMYDEDTPYTVLIQDNDLKSDTYYNKLYWNGRMKWLVKIEDALDYHPYKLLTCHGFQIFSSKVLKSFKRDYLEANGYTYRDIINIAPYEFTWYNLWIQKSEVIPIKICEPNFKTFHLKQHHIHDVLRGMKIEDWSKGYLGIVVNSNYGVGDGDYNDISFYDSKNAELNIDSVNENYKFYRKILNDKNSSNGIVETSIKVVKKIKKIIHR